ncbi:MAG: Fur family transcriptional regulator [Rubrivivax sp.]
MSQPIPLPTPRPAFAADPRKLLRSRGLRPTAPRLQVLEALLRHTPADGCLSTEDIYAAIQREGGSLGVNQIYTTLASLADAELIERYRIGIGPALFSPRRGERMSALLSCRRCQQIKGLRHGGLQSLLGALAREQGFEADETTVVLRGQCASCAAAGGHLC